MLEVNFFPFPVLKTNRLVLRQITPSDVDCVFKLRSNPETMKFVPRTIATTTEEAFNHIKAITKKIDNNEGINWAITLCNSPEMIGIIGHYLIQKENYRSEIGYMLLPEFSNQGIITEAIELVLDYGFSQLQLHSVEAIIDPKNAASEKVLIKNGFVKEAHFVENGFFEGVFIDSVVYSILKRNFVC